MALMRLLGPRNSRSLHCSPCVLKAKRLKEKSRPPYLQQLQNPVESVFGHQEHWPEDQFGRIFDNKPFKVSVKKYHLYEWCGCGWSHSQPFCDETCCSRLYKKAVVGGRITYVAPKDADMWFCMCKQTKNRPFCDGSHRDPEVQAEKLDLKFDLWDPQSEEQTNKLKQFAPSSRDEK